MFEKYTEEHLKKMSNCAVFLGEPAATEIKGLLEYIGHLRTMQRNFQLSVLRQLPKVRTEEVNTIEAGTKLLYFCDNLQNTNELFMWGESAGVLKLSYLRRDYAEVLVAELTPDGEALLKEQQNV